MTDLQLSEYFNRVLETDQELSPAVAAIKTLLSYIEQQSFGTVAEMRERVIKAIDTLTKTDSSAISIKSGCEMLLRFITLTALDAGVSYSLIQITKTSFRIDLNDENKMMHTSIARRRYGQVQSSSVGEWRDLPEQG